MTNPIFERLDQAAKKALEHQNEVFRFQPDPDLERYQQLTEADFQHLADTYGQEAVTQYVTTMESRKLKGGR